MMQMHMFAQASCADACKASLQAEQQARAALASLVFPLKQSDALNVLTDLGADAEASGCVVRTHGPGNPA